MKRLNMRQLVERNHKIVINICRDNLSLIDTGEIHGLTGSAVGIGFVSAFKIVSLHIKNMTAGKKQLEQYLSQWERIDPKQLIELEKETPGFIFKFDLK